MSEKKENILKIYSNKLLEEDPLIIKHRKVFNIKDIFDEVDDYSDLNISNVINKLKTTFKVENKLYNCPETVFTTKECQVGSYMKWHCDDASIISHKNNSIHFYDNHIKISDKKTLYYPNKIPKFSLIVYGSTYKIDFTGGILEFSDNTKIKPQKNMCVFFNSKEAHCVHRIKTGSKKLFLIKFY